MNSKLKKWSSEDEKLILHYVAQMPGNISVAFEKVAYELDRTVSSIQNRYYAFIKPKITKGELPNNLSVISKDGLHTLVNVKNERRSPNLSEQEMFDFVCIMVKKLKPMYKKEVVKIIFDL